MIAHHFSKGDKSQTKAIDRAAGGGALARWPDVVMTLTEHEEDACATAEFSLRNFAPVAPFVLRWNYPAWTRDEALDPSSLKKAGRSDKHPSSEMLSRLKDGMTKKDWATVMGWPETTFRRKLDTLVATGKVSQVSGCYYRNPP
jgi:RecA-family ATPase